MKYSHILSILIGALVLLPCVAEAIYPVDVTVNNNFGDEITVSISVDCQPRPDIVVPGGDSETRTYYVDFGWCGIFIWWDCGGLQKTKDATIFVDGEDDYVIFEINCPSGCFAGETPIAMADGSRRAIENVKVGDRILSYDEGNDRIVPARVTEVFEHSASEMGVRQVVVINGSIRVTPDHLLYLNSYWTSAGKARIGDEVMDLSRGSMAIESIESVSVQIPLYNLEVEKYHNYFAGRILAHNEKDPNENGGPPGGGSGP